MAHHHHNPTDPRGRNFRNIAADITYRDVEELRRMMTPNGKILSRKRLNVTARGQRNISRAIKRARYMALLPYTSATL